MLADYFWNAFLRPDVLGIVFGCAIPIVAIVAGFWYQTAKVRSENDLKRSMIERGFTAEDVERVLRAGRGAADEDEDDDDRCRC
jgi:hypothetical protein